MDRGMLGGWNVTVGVRMLDINENSLAGSTDCV
jgi:hypothetical protein